VNLDAVECVEALLRRGAASGPSEVGFVFSIAPVVATEQDGLAWGAGTASKLNVDEKSKVGRW
jgi:hypothetical protein